MSVGKTEGIQVGSRLPRERVMHFDKGGGKSSSRLRMRHIVISSFLLGPLPHGKLAVEVRQKEETTCSAESKTPLTAAR